MNMIQLPLDDASDDQIREFIEANGVEVGKADRPSLLSTLGSFYGLPHILVPAPLEGGEGQSVSTVHEPQQRLSGGVGKDDPKVVIEIATTQLPGGQHPVSVAVNGVALVIQRNVKVEIPYRYYLALVNAKNADVSQSDPSQPPVETVSNNYPMTVHEKPSQGEIDAWHARVDGELLPA